MSLTFRHAIVVGASSGIGAAIARELSATGCSVVLLGRREAELRAVADSLPAPGRGHFSVHDVTAYDGAADCFDEAVRTLGGLDLLVYAAGDLFVPEEGVFDWSRDRRQFEVNLLGAVRWTQLAAAHFSARRSGTVLAISSIAGERGRRTMPGYTASKAGLTAWMEALRNQVSRHGVNVVTVKPGFVDTAMTAHLTRKPMVIPAERAARLILDAARRGGSPSVFIPFPWAIVARIIRSIPSWLFRRLDI